MFCNINFKLIDKSRLFELKDDNPKCIVTVNAQFIVLANNDMRFMNILNKYDSAFDGEVPLKFARRQNEYRYAEAIKGSEIIYDFINYSKDNDLKMFLLGGKKKSNELSVKKIREEYKVQVEGFSPQFEQYPFSEKFIDDCMNRIKAYKPDIIFVGFGAPKQEFFIDDHYDEFKSIGVKYLIGCGGTFEFLSGSIKRAPRWVAKAGFESVYRLFQEFSISRIKRLIYSFRFFKFINNKPNF